MKTGVHHALNPDPYRGVFGSDGEKYAKDIQETIDYGTTGRVAGFISEAIQVCRYQYIVILSHSEVSFL
jgi:alanine-glyoxylate transaminase/(R)-3-amino-2-methylpropionate-pyruvate transaminase